MKLRFWFRDSLLDVEIVREYPANARVEDLRADLKGWRKELRDGWPAADCAYGFLAI